MSKRRRKSRTLSSSEIDALYVKAEADWAEACSQIRAERELMKSTGLYSVPVLKRRRRLTADHVIGFLLGVAFVLALSSAWGFTHG